MIGMAGIKGRPGVGVVIFWRDGTSTALDGWGWLSLVVALRRSR